MKRAKSIVSLGTAVALLVLGLCVLTGCGGGADDSVTTPQESATSGTEAAATQEDSAEEKTNYQDGMPITLSANGQDYLVESYEVSTNEDGNTVVTLFGPDFEMGTDWRDNVDLYLCFSATCAAGGQSHQSTMLSVQNMTSYSFEFAGDFTPESITVFPKDLPDETTLIVLK